jgi:hypothetical protein
MKVIVSFTLLPLFPHWIGVWVGSKVGLDDVEKEKFFTLQGL